MFYNKVQNKKKLRKFKKRGAPKIDKYRRPNKKGSYVYFKRGGNVELFVYKRILRAFRRKTRRRKYQMLFRFLPNYAITRKSRNSRMGKGKGKFRRLSLKLRTNKLFMIAAGLSYYRILFFFKNLSKNTGFRFLVNRAVALGSRKCDAV